MLQRNVNTGTMTHEHDAHAEYRLSQFQTCPSQPPPPRRQAFIGHLSYFGSRRWGIC